MKTIGRVQPVARLVIKGTGNKSPKIIDTNKFRETVVKNTRGKNDIHLTKEDLEGIVLIKRVQK